LAAGAMQEVTFELGPAALGASYDVEKVESPSSRRGSGFGKFMKLAAKRSGSIVGATARFCAKGGRCRFTKSKTETSLDKFLEDDSEPDLERVLSFRDYGLVTMRQQSEDSGVFSSIQLNSPCDRSPAQSSSRICKDDSFYQEGCSTGRFATKKLYRAATCSL